MNQYVWVSRMDRLAKAVRCLSRKKPWSRTARRTPDASRAAESRGSSRGRGVSGYLTIRGYEERGRRRSYTLGFPNHEVEDGFNAWRQRCDCRA